jgi:hypothetical protein
MDKGIEILNLGLKYPRRPFVGAKHEFDLNNISSSLHFWRESRGRGFRSDQRINDSDQKDTRQKKSKCLPSQERKIVSDGLFTRKLGTTSLPLATSSLLR